MNDLPRRDFIQRAAVAAGAVVAVAAELRPDHAYAQAAPAARRTPMTYELKKLPFDPSRIKGMSEKLLVSHYENNYTGAVKRLNAGIETCVKVGDNGSRELLEKILTDEEHHIDWLEGQLHAIKEMGIEAYLAQQLYENEK